MGWADKGADIISTRWWMQLMRSLGGKCRSSERLELTRKPSVCAADSSDVQDSLVVADLISKACPCSIDQTVVIWPPPTEMNGFLLKAVSRDTAVSVCVHLCAFCAYNVCI